MNALLARKRKLIDSLDSKLSRLLEKRLAVSASLSGLKNRVRDPEREKAVLARAAGRIRDKRLRDAVSAIYAVLLRRSRLLQSGARRADKGGRKK